MKATKLAHACVVLEEAGVRLVIDPGNFTPPVDVGDVVAVVMTHEHLDHCAPEQLRTILDRNPAAVLVGTAGCARVAQGFQVRTVAAGDHVEVGPFRLDFFGGDHAPLHESIPRPENVGVVVNGSFCYAGDSLALPGIPIDTLAATTGTPWLNLADALDHVLAVRPRRAFATHETLITRTAQQMFHDRLRWATEQGGGEYHALEPGESIEVGG